MGLFDEEKALKIVKSHSNEIIKTFIEGKFNFNSATKSQFATLEGILEQRKFNLESNEIERFILEKLDKQKSEEFFKDILKNFIEKREEILELLKATNEETEIKNNIFRDVFYLIKITFRKENALKNLDI